MRVGGALNQIIYRAVRGEERPVLFELAAFPHLQEITRNHAVIRRELDAVLARREALPRYHDIDVGSTSISESERGEWKVFMLYAMGAKPEKNRRQCPETIKLLDRVPNLFQAFFSILDPGKKIPAHRGGYLGYIRYHLGLRIPRANPPRIRLHDRFHTWSYGEAILFDDAWEHEAGERERRDARRADRGHPATTAPHPARAQLGGDARAGPEHLR